MDANTTSEPSTVIPTNQGKHTFTIAVSFTLPLPTNSPSSALVLVPPSTPATSPSSAVPSALPCQGSELYHYLMASQHASQAPTNPESPRSSSPVVSQMPSPDHQVFYCMGEDRYLWPCRVYGCRSFPMGCTRGLKRASFSPDGFGGTNGALMGI